MTTAHFSLQDILTEFDERITGELNLDPLGLLVVWSAYGQRIFRHRISSNSNDIRNYTLNLFNHAVIKALIEDDGAPLGKGLLGSKFYEGGGKDSTAFKQACLIYLENVFTYAMVRAHAPSDVETSSDVETGSDVETSGVLGISKARRRWGENKGEPTLLFSPTARAHVLARQNSLGVGGRYKTPLIEMGFFNGNHDYTLPKSEPQWRKAQKQLFDVGKPLAALHKLAHAHLAELLADTRREPTRHFSDVPIELRNAFVEAFRSPAIVGGYARDFWLTVTELDQGAPGALHDVLKQEWQPNGQTAERPAVEVFAQAAKHPSLAVEERKKLHHVSLLEPFLAEVDLLFTTMLTARLQSLGEVMDKWKTLGRDGNTLPDLMAPIEANAPMLAEVAGTAADRLKMLLTVARGTDPLQHARRLINYHDMVVAARGQSPWLRLLKDDQLKIDVRTRPLPDANERPVGSWIHHYYTPQFRHFLSGLRGLA